VCPNSECKMEIPRAYVVEKFPKATVGLVGFTGHGKTAYLTSLFYLLKSIKRTDIWGTEFTWLTLDDNTHKIMFEHVKSFEDSQLPVSTPENFPHPALIEFNYIPFFGNYFLSFYDTAGRVYKETVKITETGRFVAYSDVVIFIISINDCGSSIADTMEEFLDTYINAVYSQLGVDLKKNQHLIITITKTDEIKGIDSDLREFLQSGSYRWYQIGNPHNMLDKFSQLRNKSRRIKDWLEKKGCGGFIRLAKQRFRSVEYTIVSSTGAAPIGNMLATKLKSEDPKRVLDPFLWVLEKTRQKGILEKIFGRG